MRNPIAAVMIHVADVDAGFARYRRAFPEATLETLVSPTFSRLSLAGVSIELVPSDHQVASGAAGSVVYWYVQNLEVALSHLQRVGATLYRGPLPIEEGQRMCQVKDPWGNCIGLRGPSQDGGSP